VDGLLWQKILTELASPLALSLIALAIALLLRALRWRRLAWTLAVLAFAWLWVWSLPAVSLRIGESLERGFPVRAIAEYPQVDAIVLLGGGVEGRRAGWRAEPVLLPAADRVWFAARLFRAERAPRLIVSGGNTEWSRADQSEADAMAEFLSDLGVPAEAVLRESQSRSTQENAIEVKKLLDANGIRSVLLVTSALHMRRALATFAAAGIDAVAAPADIEAVPPRESTALYWIPDARALDDSSRALKEYAGLWVYRLRGAAN